MLTLLDRQRNCASDLVHDLAEDLATRWAPDVLADGDLAYQVSAPSLDISDRDLLRVPRVNGKPRTVLQLSGRSLAYLRNSVQLVRDHSESALGPTVCGYRTGAAGDVGYDREYRRYKVISTAILEEWPFVLGVDLKNFFNSVSRTSVRNQMSVKFGDAWEPIDSLLASLESHGHPGLPAGYGDSRLIANLILSSVDDAVESDFARWVDDYRIGVRSEADADRVVEKLGLKLASLGLALNRQKTTLRSHHEYTRTLGSSLDSVYHPGDETRAKVRAELRQVFLRAIAESSRRLLRFALPRLASQGDDIALGFCFAGLIRNDVDAPRMASYIRHFGDDIRVRQFLEKSMLQLQDWALARVLPLVTMTQSQKICAALHETLQQTRPGPVLGLSLRMLALLGDDGVKAYFGRADIDSRAVIGACSDLDLPVPCLHLERAIPTAQAAKRVNSFSAPSTDTIL